MRVANYIRYTNIPEYSLGLIKAIGKRTCPNIAKSVSRSHDAVYRMFENPAQKIKNMHDHIVLIAWKLFSKNDITLILDDTTISKQHAREIEGVDQCFDGSTKRATLGLQMVTAMVTDGTSCIPINFMPYISKAIARDAFETKSTIATTIVQTIMHRLPIRFILADAHYATKSVLHFLFTIRMPFLMKFTCNRIVTIDGKNSQLQHLLRLKKNAHKKYAKGEFDGMHCFFYVIKVSNGLTMYFISMHLIEPSKLLARYKIRWNLEYRNISSNS